MIEFKEGDVVTFRAYPDQWIKARVKKVNCDVLRLDKTDQRVFYELIGIDQPLITKTTGQSIVESKFFKCPVKYPFKF